MRFRNRSEAGRRLASRLEFLRGEDVVVLGLPRGGVPVAAEVARALSAPLDVILVRKLGVPAQPELGLGAIGESGARVINPEVVRYARVSEAAIAQVERKERAELERRAQRFRGNRPHVPLAGRTAVIVDDGIATGSTARAACQVARALGAATVVLAAPVAPPAADSTLRGDADEVICLEMPEHFLAIGEWYDDFTQTSDEEVVALLRAARPGPGAPAGPGEGRGPDGTGPAAGSRPDGTGPAAGSGPVPAEVGVEDGAEGGGQEEQVGEPQPGGPREQVTEPAAAAVEVPGTAAAAGGPVAAGPPAGGPVAAGPPAGGPVAGGPVAAGPPAGGPVAGRPPAGGPVTGRPPAGGPVAGGPVAGAGGDKLAGLLAMMPFAAGLGIILDAASAGEVRGRLAWAPGLCTSSGLLHGGVLMALADSLGGICAFLNLPPGALTATTSSATVFTRAVRSGEVTAVTRPLHVGRTAIVVQTDLTDDRGRRVAQVTQTQAVLTGAA
jgi:putative phosphoribosyl transferase